VKLQDLRFSEYSSLNGCDAVKLPVDTAPSLKLQHEAHNFKCCKTLSRHDDNNHVFNDSKGWRRKQS